MNYRRLTPPQENIWNLQKYYVNTSISNICGVIVYNEKRDEKLLKNAINEIIKSQEGLRLVFTEENVPMQAVAEYSPLDIETIYFSNQEEFDEYAKAFATKPILFSDDRLYRFVVVNIGEKIGVLVALSHLISDAWSLSVIAKATDEVYFQLLNGGQVNICKYSYMDFVDAQEKYENSKRYENDKKYWENKYQTRPEISAIKLETGGKDCKEAGRFVRSTGDSVEKSIEDLKKKYSLTDAVIYETAVITYLSRINYENSAITIGIPTLNRTTNSEKNTVGMYISTMPMTVDVSGNMSMLELAQKITETHYEIFRHQKYPYEKILKNLRDKQNFSGNLYDVMVSTQNSATGVESETAWYSNGYLEIPFALHIDHRDGEKVGRITVDYRTDLFKSDEEISHLIDRVEHIIMQFCTNPEKSLSEISIIPERELNRILFDFNNTSIDYAKDKCIHQMFEERVKLNPDNIALVFEDESFTYRQIDEMSNTLAHYLRKKGVKRNDIVAIISIRNWRIIVAMLGILKAGGAYMPVDPTYPKDRVEYMLETADSNIALAYGYSGEHEVETINLSDFDFSRNKEHIENINSSDDLCYVIFTSGSTGKPKGVSITHSGVGNLCTNNNIDALHEVILNDCKKMISVTSIVFDMFVIESIYPLINGLTVYLANDDQILSQEKIGELILKNKIETIQTTPSKIRSYIRNKDNTEYLSVMKAIGLGGEAVTEDLWEELTKYTSAKIINIYGPAETTVWSTNKHITSSDITIGKPISNTQIYILDSDRKLLPIGVAGELCIAGEGVGAGYINRPELTAERFIANPFANEENGHGKIMYRTGDLARWREDGEIEYLGRIDTQVKIRGLRIELGEIESIMSTYNNIRICAVADKKDEGGRQYLVGYYVSEADIDEKDLRSYLASKLPKYMIPNYLVRLTEMPMTASGKIDRKNLPIPEFSMVKAEYVAPENEIEAALCDLLSKILDMKQVGVTDDFFDDLGGDSLKAIEYVAEAHNINIDIPLQRVFDYPTVRELCESITNKKVEKDVQYSEEDFKKYISVFEHNIIDESFSPVKKHLGNILLTGSTGFLGAHVLDSLMNNETGKIYCLIRSKSDNDRRGRLKEILNYYFGNVYDNEIGKRIIPIEGNIEDDRLSDYCPEDVQTVIHTAASVKHYGSYAYFDKVNVEGTRNVVNYAVKAGAKLIHISTLSVSGNSLADDFSVYYSEEEKHFYETDLFIEQPLDNVYIRSKFEAEKVVYDAMLGGLDAKVIRVGNLTNRQSDYRFQPNYTENAFLTRVKAILEFGYFPDYLMHLYAEFSPVDMTAHGIVKIAQYADKQTVFHLNSNKPIYFDRFLQVLEMLGIKMNIVDGSEFNRRIQDTVKKSGTEYIYEAFQNDMDESGKLIYDTNIRIMNDFTDWFMRKVGFEWVKTDYEYIKGYIKYFRELGYLEV